MVKREHKSGISAPSTATGDGSGAEMIRKRSVAVAGHRTSVSLEEAFWILLCRIAAARGRSVSDLVTQIDRERTGNLSSAIRVFVLAEVARPDATAASA